MTQEVTMQTYDSPRSPTPIKSGVLLFRGMGSQQRDLSPERPVYRSAADWEGFDCLSEGTFLKHAHVLADVLGIRQIHARSFSFKREVAEYYATSDAAREYCKDGFVGEFRMPRIVQAIGAGGGRAALFLCEDDTVWLDPRELFCTVDHPKAAFLELDFVKQCAIQDDEILLVHGGVRANGMLPVSASSIQHMFRSWQRTLASEGKPFPSVTRPELLRALSAKAEDRRKNKLWAAILQ